MPQFKCAFDVKQYIKEHFPGVNIAFEMPSRAVMKPHVNRRGRKIMVEEWVPIPVEEQEKIAPFIREYRRLMAAAASSSIDDEEVLGERMI